MNIKPILFSTPMAQAILDGRKSMTRRVVKPQPINVPDGAYMDPYNHNYSHFTMWTKDNRMCLSCGGNIKNMAHWMPRYQTGDILWVREKFNDDETADVLYAADQDFIDYGCKDIDDRTIFESNVKWRPSIFMPRSAARIWLRVTYVRVERVQEILCGDMKREGCIPPTVTGGQYQQWQRDYWIPLWDGLNAKRGYSWDSNPWVWVISFERCEKPQEGETL